MHDNEGVAMRYGRANKGGKERERAREEAVEGRQGASDD